ncbi:MAG: hypothetical protein HC788_15805, partial [Sphingopyxis sp.]|nr:hypothetical protein [Sphingopyxis sp.]
MNYRRTMFAVAAIALANVPTIAIAADADSSVAAARVAARENRHADAIAAFREAIALAPERRGEWLVELADQLTWSQQLGAAITTYREALAGGDAAARRGLARALSWAGQHDAAVREYDQLLALSPQDRDVALARIAAPGGPNLVIFGHSHVAGLTRAPNGGVYANPGGWGDVPRYLAITASRIELREQLPSGEDRCLDLVEYGSDEALATRRKASGASVATNRCTPARRAMTSRFALTQTLLKCTRGFGRRIHQCDAAAHGRARRLGQTVAGHLRAAGRASLARYRAFRHAVGLRSGQQRRDESRLRHRRGCFHFEERGRPPMQRRLSRQR